jgi:LysR family transcriptional regulator for bpeEF and oprC
MDRFDAMRAFVQVLESGSYTQAARQLNLHKATVSQQIQQLEERLGTRLLTRTTRSVAPTAEGTAYYAHACSILQQVDEAETLLREGASAAAGHLRVNVPVAMGRLVFAPEIRHFLQRYPRITIELGCTDRAVDLVTEGVDCALRGGQLPDSSLSARRVGDLRFVLCAAPHYIEQHGLPETAEALARHHQIGHVSGSSGKLRPIVLSRDGYSAEFDLPARLVTTDSAVALSAGLDVTHARQHLRQRPVGRADCPRHQLRREPRPGDRLRDRRLPAGLALAEADIQHDLDRRRPGTSRHVTQRNEADRVEILSGVYEGQTTGTPIAC